MPRGSRPSLAHSRLSQEPHVAEVHRSQPTGGSCPLAPGRSQARAAPGHTELGGEGLVGGTPVTPRDGRLDPAGTRPSACWGTVFPPAPAVKTVLVPTAKTKAVAGGPLWRLFREGSACHPALGVQPRALGVGCVCFWRRRSLLGKIPALTAARNWDSNSGPAAWCPSHLCCRSPPQRTAPVREEHEAPEKCDRPRSSLSAGLAAGRGAAWGRTPEVCCTEDARSLVEVEAGSSF
ncbi:uncharacterized protein LOC119544775 [Choloepus didactylus]|uniref:uncharacterized protein LOC119544775 n=1 Tax=Choloepus didactylus TaxID=27675 RepID=UPI00189C8558|nr:uncharacterized protein LOC119544775 [Choloepus didactylus]